MFVDVERKGLVWLTAEHDVLCIEFTEWIIGHAHIYSHESKFEVYQMEMV